MFTEKFPHLRAVAIILFLTAAPLAMAQTDAAPAAKSATPPPPATATPLPASATPPDAASAAAPASTKPGVTVLIIRHAEKQSNGGGLSKKGLERAQKYIGYFQHFQDGEKALVPTAFYAARDTPVSMRPRLTLDPLARAAGVPLSTAYKSSDSDKLADLIHSGRLSGRTILVCWHHGDVPDLLTALGADPKVLLPHGEWPDGIYGWLIELRLAGDGTLQSSKILNEKLMPNDRLDPPVAAPAPAVPIEGLPPK